MRCSKRRRAGSPRTDLATSSWVTYLRWAAVHFGAKAGPPSARPRTHIRREHHVAARPLGSRTHSIALASSNSPVLSPTLELDREGYRATFR